MVSRYGRMAAIAAAGTLVIASCGGSDGDDAAPVDIEAEVTEPEPADEPAEETDAPAADETDEEQSDDAAADDPPAADEPADDSGSDDAGEAGSAGDFTPGPIEFRAVNLLDEPVDLYARTTGLVEAFLVQPGLAPGEVSDWIAPPDEGILLVTQAGADDPTCVGFCDQFIAELSTFPEEGPRRTVVLWGDEFDPYQAFDLWEQPTDDAIAASNAMPPADPSTALAVVVGRALTEADFGVRAGNDGGCLVATNIEGSLLVGGTGTPAYPVDGSISMFDRDDLECAEVPVGGPFDVEGVPGSRSLVILSGSPGSMDAIVLPMESGDAPAPATSETGDGTAGGDAAGADRDLAVQLLTEDIAADGLFTAEESACFAEVLVDAVGADVVVVDGELSELDEESISPEVAAALFDAFTTGIEECGLDPAALGL